MRAIRITVREIRSAGVAGRAVRSARPRVRSVVTLCNSCAEYVAVADGECAECHALGETLPRMPWSVGAEDEAALERECGGLFCADSLS